MISNHKVLTGIIVIVAIAIAAYFFIPRFNTSSTKAGTSAPQAAQNVTTASGLVYRDEVVGSGPAAAAGTNITVNYIGALTNGQVFDSSASHGQPFTFTLGAGQVIKGWDEGVMGMKVGGKRLMQIPAALAYGAKAIQGKDKAGKVVDIIPANSVLLFEVEVISVTSPAAAPAKTTK